MIATGELDIVDVESEESMFEGGEVPGMVDLGHRQAVEQVASLD